jgi:hypothetical protein
MQKNYFLKTVFTFLLCGFFSISYAADWYISSTGNDTSGDGSTGNPWASFSKAQTMAGSGDVIHVSGMIDMWSDPANTTFTIVAPASPVTYSTTNKTGVFITKNLIIQGTSPATDGFQGKNGANTTRFFQITNALYTLNLQNLKLANGAIASDLATVAVGGGAIMMTIGNIVAENVVFEGNSATGHNAITGGAVYISGTNTSTTSFKNCSFLNNVADKCGAIYINNWSASSAIKFESCSFIANESRLAFGGSAIFIRSANDNNSLSLINCTVSKNKVLNASTNGGAIYPYKGSANTVVNVINCTISENTTAGPVATSAGIYMFNSGTTNYNGKLFISNSIIENNTAAGGVYADFNTSATAPTTTTLQINNSIIGRQGASSVIPAGCFGATNQFGYLSATSTTNELKAGLAPFNPINNTFPLYTGSMAIAYGNSTYLTGLTPPVTTDQLGNVRTVGATNYAGAWEATPFATTTPSAPTALVATAGNGQLSLAFKTAATGGTNVTNYKYSVNGDTFVALDPAATTSPIVITGLTNNTEYTVKLKAVNANGDSPESVISNAVTPTGTTAFENTLATVRIYKDSNNQLVVANSSSKTGNVSIFNTLGQQIANRELRANATIQQQLHAGIYVVMLTIEGKSTSCKIII